MLVSVSLAAAVLFRYIHHKKILRKAKTMLKKKQMTFIVTKEHRECDEGSLNGSLKEFLKQLQNNRETRY